MLEKHITWILCPKRTVYRLLFFIQELSFHSRLFISNSQFSPQAHAICMHIEFCENCCGVGPCTHLESSQKPVRGRGMLQANLGDQIVIALCDVTNNWFPEFCELAFPEERTCHVKVNDGLIDWQDNSLNDSTGGKFRFEKSYKVGPLKTNVLSTNAQN